MDIAAAEEEITRWKVAAEDEAAAGRAVEQEFVAQVRCLYQYCLVYTQVTFNNLFFVG